MVAVTVKTLYSFYYVILDSYHNLKFSVKLRCQSRNHCDESSCVWRQLHVIQVNCFALEEHRLPRDFPDICCGDVYSHEAVISNPKCDHHVISVLPSPIN